MKCTPVIILLSHAVELVCQLRLLVSRAVLMNKILCSRTVYSLDGNLIGANGCIMVALGNGCVEFLDVGLEQRLCGSVLGVSRLCEAVPLCRGFNVGHFPCHLLL